MLLILYLLGKLVLLPIDFNLFLNGLHVFLIKDVLVYMIVNFVGVR